MRLAPRSVASESSWLLPLRPPNRVLAPCLTGVRSVPTVSTLGLWAGTWRMTAAPREAEPLTRLSPGLSLGSGS